MYIWFLLTLLSLVLITIDIVVIVRINKKKQEYISVEATVVDIIKVEGRDIDGHTIYYKNTIFEYFVNDERYETKYNGFNDKFKKGQKINILYDENDPNKISVPSITFVGPLVLTILSIFSIAVTVILLVLGV